jgi:hypothetical protein
MIYVKKLQCVQKFNHGKLQGALILAYPKHKKMLNSIELEVDCLQSRLWIKH